MWLGLTWVDWLVLAGYLVGVTVLGAMAYRKVSDTADFFMGGRRFGKIMMMFFAFGSGTSSEQATAVVAGTWRAGLAGIWWQFLWLWATPFYWIVAPLMRRMRALTTSDFFEARFHRSTAGLYAVYGILMAVVMIAGALYASGKMVNALTGGELNEAAERLDLRVIPQIRFGEDGILSFAWQALSGGDAAITFSWKALSGYEMAILAITILFVVYGMAGGLGAAIWTDFIQGILTITFSFLLLPWVFAKVGGLSALREQSDVKEGMLDLIARPEVAAILGKEPITVFYVLMLSLTALAGIVVQPHIMGVCGAGKTEFEGRFGFTVGNFIKRFCTLAWTFTALACIVWYLGSEGPLANPDAGDPDRQVKIETYETLKKRSGEHYKNLRSNAALYRDALSPGGKTTEQQQIDLARALKTIDHGPGPIPDDPRMTDKDREDMDRAVVATVLTLTEKEMQDLDKFDKDFADELFGRAAYDILPGVAPGLVGLLLASLLAAMMSTCDAQMIVGSGLFTENIYRRYLSPDRPEAHYLWVGRIASLAIVAAALILQTTFTDVIDALKVIIKTPAAIGISLWIGIMWRRWTSAAVWVSSITAYVAWFVVDKFPEVILGFRAGVGPLQFMAGTNPEKVSDAWTMFIYLAAGVIAGLAVSLITPRVSKEKLDKFFRLMRTPVTPGEVILQPCTLPEDAAEPIGKLFDHPDIEIPKPTFVDLAGFAGAWVLVGLIIALTVWLAG